ncbi:MAG: hypothetical protein IJ038_07205 [Clostridia bacterium]|nr:hypothetical protein [Clostridia bacterium]
MGNVFHEFYDTLKQNEKDLLIRTSGSTSKDKNERIRSGQSYLYKKQGMESEVIEIRFDKKVSGSALTSALALTKKRYPYFRTKLVEKDGDFYIVQNRGVLSSRRTKKLSKLGHISVGKHLIDVTYHGNTIFVSFHHALCDGRGVMPFVETLVYYYCRQQYKTKKVPEGVRLRNDPLLPGETFDPFMQGYEFDENKEFISLSRDAFAIPENKPSEDSTDYRCEFKVSHTDFMRVCKENNATPVILVSLLMSKAIAEIYPDYDKPINANIATDMREALDCPNTYKNCVKSMILPYSRELSQKTLKMQATEQREILKAQRDRDYCRKEANAMLGLFNKLDSLPSFEEKQKIMSYFDSFLLNTYVVSYLGQFKLGENAEHVREMYFYNSGAAGLGINMIACESSFCIEFKQSFASNRYARAFSAQLDKLGIGHTMSEMIPFLTPTDSIMKRKKSRKGDEK